MTGSGWDDLPKEMQDALMEDPDDIASPEMRVAKYADEAMFTAVPIGNQGKPVEPKVTLVSMTANPLRTLAAASEMYQGRPVSDPSAVSRTLALEWFAASQKNKLQAPLEFIDLHFLIENVSRGFTHQMVRQRTAVYVQESMRFAVKDQAVWEVSLPPSLENLDDDDPRRVIWDTTVGAISSAYNALINAGIPAEDARGLLPTNIATRLHYKSNLRNLAEQSGVRLCSQAQAEWKKVWAQMVRAILTYGPESERWQQREIVKLFKPVCYATGKCEFMAETDRYCIIRDRVEAHHRNGDAPDTWSDIDPREPLHAMAARRVR
jgi:flavin-dependent thymidylate synthase